MSKFLFAILFVGLGSFVGAQDVVLVACPPATSVSSGYYSSQRVVYADPETHHIINTGEVYSKHYVKVKIPEGSIHSVAVINGWLPAISVRTSINGRPNTLVLDYSERIPYVANGYGNRGYIVYGSPSSNSEMRGSNSLQAPAPRHPDAAPPSSYGGSPRRLSDEDVDRIVDRLKDKMPATAPQMPHGRTQLPDPAPIIPKAPAPSRSLLDDDLIRPSQIPESGNFPRY